MGLDLASFDAGLKIHYNSETYENLTFANNPLYALISKYTKFGGKSHPLEVQYGNAQGRSASFARAQAGSVRTAGKYGLFNLTRVRNYGVTVIDNETIKASVGDANAFMEARITEIDGVIREVTNAWSLQMYLDGSGYRGQVGSISTTTLTLLNIDDAVNFEIGMELVGAATAISGAIRAVGSSTNGIFITAVNYLTGVLTFGFNVTDATNGIPTLAANDYLFVRGDRIETAGGAKQVLSGIEAWIPFTAPTTGDNFFGLDRSVNPTRLAGLSLDISDRPLEEGFVDGSVLVNRLGGNIDHIFTTYKIWAALEKSLGSKVNYVDLKANAQIGFRGIEIMGQKAPIKIVPDRNCPPGKAYGLTMDTWKIYSLGEPVGVIDTDGNTMLRQGAADGIEIRHGGYMQLGCNAPAWNINMKVA